MAIKPLVKIQRRFLLEYRQEAAAYPEKLQEYEAAKREAKEEGKDPGPPPEPPVQRRVLCADTTIEKLCEILEDNCRGTLVERDELAGWLGSFSRYKGKAGGSDLPAWLEMHRAGTVIIDRKTGERRTLFIPRANVSVCGGIQPGVLARALSPEFFDAGLAARLLMGMPDRRPKRWSEAELEPEIEEDYIRILERLLELPLGRDADGEPRPHALTLAPDAKAAWVAYYNTWGHEQAAVEGELAAAYSKLEGYSARLALVHHVVSHVAMDADDQRPVGLCSMEAGITLSQWFAAEARRIYVTLAESAEERDTRRLVESIQGRGGKTTTKELQRSNSRKYPTAEAATLALEALTDAGWGEWVDRPTGDRGGRPTSDFVLHPTIDETDQTHPADDNHDSIASDQAADDTLRTNENPNVSEGFVGNVDSRIDESGAENWTDEGHAPETDPGGFVGREPGEEG
jgi:hypothetical protein